MNMGLLQSGFFKQLDGYNLLFFMDPDLRRDDKIGRLQQSLIRTNTQNFLKPILGFPLLWLTKFIHKTILSILYLLGVGRFRSRIFFVDECVLELLQLIRHPR